MTSAPPAADPVKVLFASCSAGLLERAVGMAVALRPELPLIVISESQPSTGLWIQYHSDQTFANNLRRCRRTLDGKRIEVGVMMLQSQNPYRKLQAIPFFVRAECLLAANENMDYFEVRVRAAGTILRHLRWRAGEWWHRIKSVPIPHLRVPPAIVIRARAAGFLIGLSKLFATTSEKVPEIAATERPAGISVVIPSRNGKDMLARMLPAVVQQNEDGETIVVNNGSEDGTAEWLRRHFPGVVLLDHEAGLPFPIAVNIGVRAARFSHVCLLNNDMAIAPGFLRHLRQAFERVPDLFCAAAQVFLPPGLPRQETGKTFIRTSPAISDFPVRCDLPIEGESLSYVLYGSSGCSMYDAGKLAGLDGFDETYAPAYVEDLDAGVRAWQRGWPTVFVADAHVIHEHRATMSKLYSKARLEYMVVHHWLLFLARTIRQRSVFTRYWRHTIARLRDAATTTPEAGQVLRSIRPGAPWRTRSQGAALRDAEIFALCDGSVAVFPGAQEDAGRPVLLIVRVGLPDPGGADAEFRQVLVALVDRLGPMPADLREHYAEIVTVERGSSPAGSASFRAALRQTVRKWRPSTVRLQAQLAERYSRDLGDSKITIEP